MVRNFLKKYSLQFIGVLWVVFFLVLYGMGIASQVTASNMIKGLNGLKRIDNGWQDSLLITNNPLFRHKPAALDQIVIIGIDEESTEIFGRYPWSRDIIASGVQLINEGKPAAIGIDVLFTEYTDLESGADAQLVQSIKDAGNVVVVAYGDDLVSNEGVIYSSQVELPFPELGEVATVAHINTIPDQNVIRQTLNQLVTNEGTLPSFAIAIYQQYAKSLELSDENISTFTNHQEINGLTYFDYPCGQEDFTYYSFINLFEEDFDFNQLQDKIVLIGPYAVGMQDAYLTPISKVNSTYGVAIWATILQNLINGGKSVRTMPVADIACIVLCGLLISIVSRKMSLVKSGVFLVLLSGIFIVSTQFAYGKGIRLSLAYTLVLMIMIYLSVLIIKYIKEYQERKRITGVFGKYVAPQVVKKVLEEGEAALELGGSRRFVTLLFVDIRGFTTMSEKAMPEQVVEILNEYLNLCATSIVNHEGTLDKFIGDATMAIYNAPIQIENHALAAIKTALAMKEGSMSLEKKLVERFGRAVKFGIGINTGYAVIGNIGCHFRMDYTAIGDTVNTAARLEANAKPGQILISESTYELVKDQVVVTPLGEIKVKGKEEPIKIYQVEGLVN